MAQPQKKKLGEILAAKGLINVTQLNNALKKANQTGNKIGASFIMLGYLTEEQILTALSESLSVPMIDISKKVISVETQQAFPYEFVRGYRIVPIEFANKQMLVAMEDPTDYNLVKEIKFKTNYAIKPILASSYQINAILKFFDNIGYEKKPCDLAKLKNVESKSASLNIDELLLQLIKLDGSDLHIAVGAPPSVRLGNKIVRLNFAVVDQQAVVKFTMDLLNDEQKREFARTKEIEIAYMREDIGRFRIVIYRQRGSITICARNLKKAIPSFESLGLPPILKKLATKRQGLILVTGPAGHGKTTTAAAIIDYINEELPANIITLEDPVEYLHKHKKSNVNQREIGEDCPSFASALKHIFRQNPDVIMIGELRDSESISIAIKAATTGHLVLATLHSLDTTSTIDTILNYFSGDSQNIVRSQFADALVCILSQRLVPKKGATGRVLAYEIMLNSPRVSNLIREGKAFQIKTQTTTAKGDIEALEYSLAKLYSRGLISYDDAVSYVDSEKVFNDAVAVVKQI